MRATLMRFGLIALLASQMAIAAEVKLTPEQRETLGIKIETPTSISVPRIIQASAQVLDPAPLITLLGDVHAAQIAAAGSRNELKRLARLHAEDLNASLKSVETARAQAATDSGRVATLRAQLATTWGRSLASLSDRERSELVDGLSDGRVSLVRADVVERGVAQFNPSISVVRSLGDNERWTGKVLGRTMQAGGIGAAYLLRVQTDLQPGRVLVAQMQDAEHTQRGYKISRDAVIRWQGSDWVFVESGENNFTRQIVHPLQWLDDGVLVQDDLAHAKVVTVGGMMLLGAEGAAEGGAEKPAKDD